MRGKGKRQRSMHDRAIATTAIDLIRLTCALRGTSASTPYTTNPERVRTRCGAAFSTRACSGDRIHDGVRRHLDIRGLDQEARGGSCFHTFSHVSVHVCHLGTRLHG